MIAYRDTRLWVLCDRCYRPVGDPVPDPDKPTVEELRVQADRDKARVVCAQCAGSNGSYTGSHA